MATKKIPAPKYTTTKKLLPSIKQMRSELGAQDARVQLQELSIQYLFKAAAASGLPIGDFLKPLFQENNISQGTFNFDELRELSSKFYLTGTYALFEKMLRELISDYQLANPSLVANWKKESSKGKKLPPLQELLCNLPPAAARRLKVCSEYKLFEYYRLVRVANSHVKDKTLSSAEKSYKSISPTDFSHFRTYDSSSAPSDPKNISFSDFFLFTRAIKYYSKLLNEECA